MVGWWMLTRPSPALRVTSAQLEQLMEDVIVVVVA